LLDGITAWPIMGATIMGGNGIYQECWRLHTVYHLRGDSKTKKENKGGPKRDKRGGELE